MLGAASLMNLANALFLLAVLARQVASDDQCPNHASPIKPKYKLANVISDHLSHVKDAFNRLGYEAASPDDPDFTVLWAFHSPFHQRAGEPDVPALVDALQPGQMVNQLPGAAAFASKRRLAAASGALDFLPPSFLVPKQLAELQAAAAADADATWLVKGATHRGVEFLESVADVDAWAAAGDGDGGAAPTTLVQRVVRPHLIEDKLWDVGVYVAVTSVNPLRVYVYDNLLLRHCTEPYVRDLKNATKDAYVIAEDYAPPWALPALRPYYVRGFSTANVLRAYMSDQGVDFEPVIEQMKEDVVRLLLHFEPALRAEARHYPGGSRSFFALFRFDFMLDEALRPWLIEVNQSPNLSSESTLDLRNMFQRISFSLLNLVGFGLGQLRHPGNPEGHGEIIGHHNDVDIGWRVCAACTGADGSEAAGVQGELDGCDGDCAMCRRCRTPEQSRMIQELISEHRNRQGFLRLFPLTHAMMARPALANVTGPTATDDMLRVWVRERCLTDPSWC